MRPESPDRDAALIIDIVQAADDALEFVRDLVEAEFQSSRLHQNAVIRALEVIGEAAGSLSSAFRDQHSGVPWRRITNMRNRLIHGYATVRFDLVWHVVHQELPLLLNVLRPLCLD